MRIKVKKDYKGAERRVAVENINFILKAAEEGILKSVNLESVCAMEGSASDFIIKSILNLEIKSSVSAPKNKPPSSVQWYKLRASAGVFLTKMKRGIATLESARPSQASIVYQKRCSSAVSHPVEPHCGGNN